MNFKCPPFTMIASVAAIVLVAGIFPSSLAVAQLSERARPFGGPGDFERQMHRRPEMHTILLTSVPSDWVKVTGPREWLQDSQPYSHSGSILSGYTLRMVRQIPYADYCKELRTDSVDLRRLRANGYTLVRYRIIPFKPAAQYFDKPTYRTRPPANPADAETIGVSWTFGISQLTQSCWSGYGLEIEVHGPKEIDPVTGQKRTRSQVN